jgi:hypothetical protein
MPRSIRRAVPAYDAALFRRAAEGGNWHRWDVDPFVPTSVAVGVTTAAFVSADGVGGGGRWVVRCPFCPGAQLADPERTTRFLCVDCLNEAVGGQWVAVEWPPEPEDIEEVLEVRPDPDTQNWLPGETVEDLLRENSERGVG